MTGMVQILSWRLNSKLIAQLSYEGESIYDTTNYTVTGEMLPNGTFSNLTFVVQLQSGAVTLEFRDSYGMSNTWSYSILVSFLVFTFPNQSIK